MAYDKHDSMSMPEVGIYLPDLEPASTVVDIEDRVYRGRGANANARKTHCVNRHEFTKANTYWDANGYRSCVTCRADAAQRARTEDEGDPMETLNVLPDTEFLGLVRTRDPETSWTAAEKQTRSRCAALREHVLWILKESGPLTDDQIVARYGVLVTEHPMFYNWATPQSIRTRRKELVDGRRGVEKSVVDTGVKRDSANGGPSTVWAAL